MNNRIRIESHDNVVTNAKVFYVPEEGDEVDISRCVQGIDVNLKVGELSRATLHVILVDSDVTSPVEDVIVTRLKPQQRFRKARGWKREQENKLKTRIARSLSPQIQREYAQRARRSR